MRRASADATVLAGLLGAAITLTLATQAAAAPRADAARNELFAPGASAPARGAPAESAGEAEDAPAPVEAARDSAPYRPRASAINPLSTVSLDQLAATRERPLFSPSRRPPPPAALAVAAPAPPPAQEPSPAEPEQPQFKLIGVVHGADIEIGLFVDSAGKVARVRVGDDTPDGWTLRSVDPRLAVLEKETQQATLQLAPRDADLNSPSENAFAALDGEDIGPRPGVRPPPSPIHTHAQGRRPPRNAAAYDSFE